MSNTMVPLIMGHQNIFAYDKLPSAGWILNSFATIIVFTGSPLVNRYKHAFAAFV